jgi:hypothetical protein
VASNVCEAAGNCFCASGKAQISTAQIWLHCTLARSTLSFLHNCEPTASYVYCCNMHVHIREHANFRMKVFWWGHGEIIGAVQNWDIPLFVKFLWGNLAQLQHLSTRSKLVGVHVHPNCSSTCFTVESSYGLFCLQMNQHHCW